MSFQRSRRKTLHLKKDWELRGKDMRYLISEVLETVNTAVLKTAYPIRKILAMLGIAPS